MIANNMLDTRVCNNHNKRRAIACPKLLDAELLCITVEHEFLASDETDFQDTARRVEFLVWNAVNKSMAFESRAPDGWEIHALVHQVGAHAS
jgi:hypothetical protein